MNEDGMKNFSYIWWLKIYQCELCFLFWEGRRDVLQTRQGHACTAQDTFSFQACFTYLTPTIGLLQGGLWSHCVCVWGGGDVHHCCSVPCSWVFQLQTTAVSPHRKEPRPLFSQPTLSQQICSAFWFDLHIHLLHFLLHYTHSPQKQKLKEKIINSCLSHYISLCLPFFVQETVFTPLYNKTAQCSNVPIPQRCRIVDSFWQVKGCWLISYLLWFSLFLIYYCFYSNG